MKVVSFNVNGLRARLHQLSALVEKHRPDVIGLQETKVEDQLFPRAEIESLGYNTLFHGQRGHYGVALLSRQAPVREIKGFDHDGEQAQRRLVGAEFATPAGPIHIYNGYFPQGENREHPSKFPAKEAFYRDLLTHLRTSHTPRDNIIVMGDMNVAPGDTDIGIGEDNRKRWLRTGKCCFLPEEREWLAALMDWGLRDTYHEQHPDAASTRYSWFDYRSRGFERDPRRGLRIDLILASSPLLTGNWNTGIDYEMRGMERPSDHCPVWFEFSALNS